MIFKIPRYENLCRVIESCNRSLHPRVNRRRRMGELQGFYMNLNESSADRCPLQIKFNRIYDAEEDKRRFKIFKKTLAKVAAQNERYDRGESTWQAGINEFSDQTGFPG